jgi:hypothetical protein
LWAIPLWKSKKEEKMKPTSKKLTVSAAALFTSLFFVMGAPAAYADDYCITSGAQVAHGCGYPTMEACHAASAGIGGICSQSASSKNPSEAMAKQQPSRRAHSRKQPVGQ